MTMTPSVAFVVPRHQLDDDSDEDLEDDDDIDEDEEDDDEEDEDEEDAETWQVAEMRRSR